MSKINETEDLYEKLKEMLLSGRFEPGERLQVDVIATDLGTSRTPIREAIIRLAHEKIILKIPLVGYFVGKMESEELENLYELNSIVLDYALSTRRANSRQINNIRNIKEKLSDNNSYALFPTKYNVFATIVGDLFAEIASMSMNIEFVQIVRNINDRLLFARVAECTIISTNLNDLLSIAHRWQMAS